MAKTKVNTTDNIKDKPATTDADLDRMATKTGEELSGQPRQKVRIPMIPGGDDCVECCINGYNYMIKRGVSVELPESVVELLANAGIV